MHAIFKCDMSYILVKLVTMTSHTFGILQVIFQAYNVKKFPQVILPTDYYGDVR